jgi:four helix bundle protein
MSLGHEKLDVYQLAIQYVAWVFQRAEKLTGAHRHARDQWLRASQSIPLNIAEGNGKSTSADRRRFFEIARGSALECAAVQDVLFACNALEQEEHESRKHDIDRISVMLSRLGGRGFSLEEEQASYGDEDFDNDFDFDFEQNQAK